jgi:predicted porin
MKKTLLACTLLGAFAGSAYAQGHITVYGLLDSGYSKSTGSDLRVGSNVDSRMGFRGTEDLGDGLTAEFNLEHCINMSDGTRGARHPNYQDQSMRMNDVLTTGNKSLVWVPPEWQSVANIGLRSQNWGNIHIGRVVNYAIENYRSIDPFEQNGVSAGLYTLVDSEVNAKTIRYDSPNWNGFRFGLAYTLGQNTNSRSRDLGGDYLKEYHIDNDGWLVGARYTNGGFDILGNYEKIVDSNDSYKWNIGAAYTFSDASWGSLKVSAGYETMSLQAFNGLGKDAAVDIFNGLDHSINERNAIVGLQYRQGPHTVNASYNHGKIEYGKDSKANKYALGYTYNLSKRTSLYANVSYLDADDEMASVAYNTYYPDLRTGQDKVTSYQIGITHKF